MHIKSKRVTHGKLVRAVRRVDSGWVSTTNNFVPDSDQYSLGQHDFSQMLSEGFPFARGGRGVFAAGAWGSKTPAFASVRSIAAVLY